MVPYLQTERYKIREPDSPKTNLPELIQEEVPGLNFDQHTMLMFETGTAVCR